MKIRQRENTTSISSDAHPTSPALNVLTNLYSTNEQLWSARHAFADVVTWQSPNRSNMKRHFIAAFAGPLLLVGLSACTVTPARVAFVAPVTVLVAPLRPPPLRVEVITPAPSHEYFWVSGHWRWEGDEHRWHEGHWERHRQYEQWVAPRWEQNDHGQWRFHDGYWRPV